MEHTFMARQVEMSDGSVLFEVVGPEMVRVATCTDEDAAEDLEMILNMALTDWCEANTLDRVAA